MIKAKTFFKEKLTMCYKFVIFIPSLLNKIRKNIMKNKIKTTIKFITSINALVDLIARVLAGIYLSTTEHQLLQTFGVYLILTVIFNVFVLHHKINK